MYAIWRLTKAHSALHIFFGRKGRAALCPELVLLLEWLSKFDWGLMSHALVGLLLGQLVEQRFEGQVAEHALVAPTTRNSALVLVLRLQVIWLQVAVAIVGLVRICLSLKREVRNLHGPGLFSCEAGELWRAFFLNFT